MTASEADLVAICERSIFTTRQPFYHAWNLATAARASLAFLAVFSQLRLLAWFVITPARVKTLRQHLATVVTFVLLLQGAGIAPTASSCCRQPAAAAQACPLMKGGTCAMCSLGGKSSAGPACRMTCVRGDEGTPWLLGLFGDVPPAAGQDTPPSCARVALAASPAPADAILVPHSPPPEA
jgi:hypothetical protein